jgi:hypothetical protein
MTGKRPGTEVAVLVHRVPAGLDAAHVGFVITDVLGGCHCGAPVRSSHESTRSHRGRTYRRAWIIVAESGGGLRRIAPLRAAATTGARSRRIGFEEWLAVVAALAPVCVDKFRALPDADAKQVVLSKVESWKRRDEFPKEFVTLPGESYPSSALVDACYTLLFTPKSAALK